MRPDDKVTVELTSDMIRLGQFLKFADVADSGAEAGAMITEGDVSVDGEIETRRGRQLTKGMLVEVRLPERVWRGQVG